MRPAKYIFPALLVLFIAFSASADTGNYRPDNMIKIDDMGKDTWKLRAFSLDKELTVRIYMTGEGFFKNMQMYNYGRIIDAGSREKIRTLDLNNTGHAGGTQKNRLLNKTIDLDAGEYTVHYETDDSYSYNNWNSNRPDDYQYWGIMILLINNYQE